MIVIRRLSGLATVQDLGRVGYASHAVPRGGALCRDLLRRANRALGNDDGAACIEVFGRLSIVAESDIEVATEEANPIELRAGEELTLDPEADLRVRYLAIAGGVDAPVVLGSRSAMLPCFGNALHVGDRLAAGVTPRRQRAVASMAREGFPTEIALVPGPDHPSACGALASGKWRIGVASNRVGTRLEGTALPRETRDTLPSSPTALGAIQLPSGGAPIVIGPDGPTTGGYPIVAVIARAHVDRFHAIPLGARVSFVRC